MVDEAIHIHCRCLSPKAKTLLMEAIDDLRKKKEVAGESLDEVTDLMDIVIKYTDDCPYPKNKEESEEEDAIQKLIDIVNDKAEKSKEVETK